MKIQVNTDTHIVGREALVTRVEDTVQRALRHFEDRITRVEVHLSDENAGKSGPHDKRCVMEARLEGRQPIAATDEASTLDQATRGAAEKLARLIESQLGRVASSIRTPDVPTAEASE